MLRILRRFLVLLAALLLPLYAVSLTERLEIPAVWHEIAVGDSHALVRTRLRMSGLADRQCEWLAAGTTVERRGRELWIQFADRTLVAAT